MLSKIWSFGVRGIEGFPVSVEVDIAAGLPTYATVGLPDAEVRESKERVTAAVRNSGFDFPLKRITVNLGPAELKKGGTHFDLPIAVGIMAASGQLSKKAVSALQDTALAGELALDGTLRPVAGILPMMLAAKAAGTARFIIPVENTGEAGASGMKAFTVADMRSLVLHLEGKSGLDECLPGEIEEETDFSCGDFSEVKSQAVAKRALEIAATGGHNVLLIGPPGTGKSMLARRFASILPGMEMEEALEVARIYSVCGMGRRAACRGRLSSRRPFRDPHHTVSDIALSGGGSSPRPGEVSLSHNGVLFLDELPEFSRSSLEVLRQPLESFRVTVTRVKETVIYPARFTLIAAMNPCPCGYLGHPEKQCSCMPLQVHKYRSKISGPLLDRIDIHVQLAPVGYADWAGSASGEASAAISGRVISAREIQKRRFKNSATPANAFMETGEMRRFCRIPADGGEILESAMNSLGLSARSLDKVLKVARSIADLEEAAEIRKEHIIEAVQYRCLDRSHAHNLR
ncbi:MAG: YifB family Mg chelatase-like AAA ATPase [bacterium]